MSGIKLSTRPNLQTVKCAGSHANSMPTPSCHKVNSVTLLQLNAVGVLVELGLGSSVTRLFHRVRLGLQFVLYAVDRRLMLHSRNRRRSGADGTFLTVVAVNVVYKPLLRRLDLLRGLAGLFLIFHAYILLLNLREDVGTSFFLVVRGLNCSCHTRSKSAILRVETSKPLAASAFLPSGLATLGLLFVLNVFRTSILSSIPVFFSIVKSTFACCHKVNSVTLLQRAAFHSDCSAAHGAHYSQAVRTHPALLRKLGFASGDMLPRCASRPLFPRCHGVDSATLLQRWAVYSSTYV